MLSPLLLPLLFLSAPAHPQATPVEVGMKAPAFSAPDQAGRQRDLGAFLDSGRMLVLLFYPGDYLPEATKHLRYFKERIHSFLDLQISLAAISSDPIASHRRFHAWLRLPFPLLSDEREEISTAFGARPDAGAHAVIVINSRGRVVYADRAFSLTDGASFRALMRALSVQPHKGRP